MGMSKEILDEVSKLLKILHENSLLKSVGSRLQISVPYYEYEDLEQNSG
jgi:hypothetical protein